MYDTFKIWGGVKLLPASPLLAIANKFTSAKETYNHITGETTITGNVGSMQARISEKGLSLYGSLPKYYLNDNFQVLSRGDTQRAIEKLSDTLSLSIKEAKVTRIDLAQNFIVKYEEPVYFNYLGACRYYQRLEQPKSLYYQNGLRQMLFYCKAIEQRAKGLPIPELYQNKNVLRYEFRWLRRLSEAFNIAEVKASTLYQDSFYIEAINRWKQSYFSIRKQKDLNFNMQCMNSVKDFEQLIYLAGLKTLFGGEREALEAVELAKKLGVFKHKMQPQRIKDKIKELNKLSNQITEPEAIQELDSKVKEAVRYYR